MKKTTFLAFITLLFFNSVNAQVLWSEDFDNLITGSVSADLTGNISGKGGWYTLAQGHNHISNFDFNIAPESGRGNVLIVCSTLKKGYDPLYAERKIWKDDIKNIWGSRNPNNNILKYEYYFFIDKKSTTKDRIFEEISNAKDGCIISRKTINGYTIELSALGITDKFNLPTNIWIKAIVYLDYYTGDLYHEYPHKNYAIKSKLNIGVIENHTLNLISFKIKGHDHSEELYQIKFDDIKISAINTLPTLNIIDLDASKFNLYPNPATNIVNITNSENISVKRVEIYDVAGKLIDTQHFTNEAEIQLNIETLTNGTYMLHLQTEEGTVVKKLIKK